MAMNVNNWYTDPAKRFNDVIYPQQERVSNDRKWKHPEKDWRHYDRHKPERVEKQENTPTKELSPAAKKLLDKLKKTYDNVDFSVAGSDTGAEAESKLSSGFRKYSVLFTNDELEKMASDEKYQKSMIDKMHEGFRTVAAAAADMGFQTAGNRFGYNEMNRVGIIYHSDGTSSMYNNGMPPMFQNGGMSPMHRGMERMMMDRFDSAFAKGHPADHAGRKDPYGRNMW